MSTESYSEIHHHTGRQRSVVYIVAAIVVVAAVVLGLVLFHSSKASAQASNKAATLVKDLEAAGIRAPDKTQIEQTLGTDGGAICANASNPLSQAVLDQLAGNGAAGPGQRPVPIDKKLLAGEALVIKNYCPDNLPEFVKFVSSLDLQNTLKG